MENTNKTLEMAHAFEAFIWSDSDAYHCAQLCAHFVTESDGYIEDNEAMELARRICRIPLQTDEARFTLYDYADAVLNMPALKLNALLALDDDAFAEAVIYMAQVKRNTYSIDSEELEEPDGFSALLAVRV